MSKRRRRRHLSGGTTVLVKTKLPCTEALKKTLQSVARGAVGTKCTDRVVVCPEGRLLITASCDTEGQAQAYQTRLRPYVKVLESVNK